MSLLYLGLARAYNSASRDENDETVPNAQRDVVDATGPTAVIIPDDWPADEVLTHLRKLVDMHTPDDAPSWFASDDKRCAAAAGMLWPDADQRDVASVESSSAAETEVTE